MPESLRADHENPERQDDGESNIPKIEINPELLNLAKSVGQKGLDESMNLYDYERIEQ